MKNKYNDEIMKTLRQRLDLDKQDTSQDEEINKMSPNEVFLNVVQWNGLLGDYDEIIKDWIFEIYGVDLNELGKELK